jgi:RNA polymerase sigma-70 factor (ECF subfamily)
MLGERSCEALARAHTLEMENRDLKDAIGRLDDIYRLLIILFYVVGFNIREVARILQIPEGTVKSRLHAGRAKLRVALG